MGSRTSGSFSSWGGGRGGFSRVATAVSGNLPASVAVGTAIGVLSATNPVIGTAVAAYSAGKMVADAVSVGSKTYQRTGDAGKAVEAAGISLAKSGANAVAGSAIDAAASVGWSIAKSTIGARTSSAADKVIASAMSSAPQEVISKAWERKRK